MKPTDLRGILRYIPHYREKTFILAIDGAIVTDENFANILLDVAVLRSLNIRVVLVHGASKQIEQLGAEQGVVPSDLDGAGVTDAATLKLALTAANRLTHEILEGLSANDLRAATTNAVIAHPAGIIHGVDQEFTGKVERVDAELLQTLLAQGIVPVVPPLGFDGDGRTYRVNSDSAAVAVADALKAIKLIYITSEDGLIVNGQLIRQMSVADLESLLQQAAARVPARQRLEGAVRRGSLPRRRAARAHHQRPRRRGPAGGSVLERGHRHADLRQRVPADPAGQEEGRARHPCAHPEGHRGRRARAAQPRQHREVDRRFLHLRDRQEPGGLRGAACRCAIRGRANWRAST